MSTTNSTVLVVDDEPAIVLLVSSILRGAGFTVWTAGSGTEALEVYRSHHPPARLVLSDIIMPDMSGAELAQHIREINPHARFLLMTGYSDQDLKDYLQGLGGAPVPLLRKPFGASGLLRQVRRALESNTTAPVFC